MCDDQHAPKMELPPIPMNYHHVHSLFPLKLPCWGQRHIFGQNHLGLKYRHGCSKAPQEMINLNSPLHLGHEHGPLHHRIATEIHPNGFTEGSANVAANIFLRSVSRNKGNLGFPLGELLDCLIFLGGWSDESCMNRAPCIIDISMSPV